MKVQATWKRSALPQPDPRFGVSVRADEDCGIRSVVLLFWIGQQEVEIRTDTAGLQLLADRLAEYPGERREAAMASLRDAVQQARQQGISDETIAAETIQRPPQTLPQNCHPMLRRPQ